MWRIKVFTSISTEFNLCILFFFFCSCYFWCNFSIFIMIKHSSRNTKERKKKRNETKISNSWFLCWVCVATAQNHEMRRFAADDYLGNKRAWNRRYLMGFNLLNSMKVRKWRMETSSFLRKNYIYPGKISVALLHTHTHIYIYIYIYIYMCVCVCIECEK